MADFELFNNLSENKDENLLRKIYTKGNLLRENTKGNFHLENRKGNLLQ